MIMSDKIIMVNIDELIPYIMNSRTHSDEQVDQLMKSIAEFGFTNPVLISKEKGVLSGHGRIRAAKLLEIDKIPCIVLEHLTDIQRRAYIITDNQLAMNAGWNDEILSYELSGLKDGNFDLSLIGFNDDELHSLLEITELGDGIQYAEKNKEIDTKSISEIMVMKFNLTKEQFEFVNDRLRELSDVKEEALLKLFEYKDGDV